MKSAITKYNEAILRNYPTWQQATQQLFEDVPKCYAEILRITKLGLDGIKIKIGIRKTDMTHDSEIKSVLEKAEGVLAKVAKSEKRIEAAAKTEAKAANVTSEPVGPSSSNKKKEKTRKGKKI